MALQPENSINDLADEPLVELYRQGRQTAFAVLLERYRQELFHFLIRFTNDASTAEDLFQEAFMQVHLSIDSFDTTRKFRPWLFTIAANKARDHLRRSRQRPSLSLSAPAGDSDSEHQFVDLMQADLALPVDDVQRNEMQEMVRATVASLPPHLREILLLAYFHQFPYKDIADMLGIPLGTVKSRLHAAVGTFAKQWQQDNGPENES